MIEDYKTYTTLRDEVTFHYPEYWMNEIEDDRTYLFYEEFLGSFRVTPRTMDPELFDVSDYLFSEFQKKEEFDPLWKDFGGKEFLYYEGDWVDKNHVYRIHHYIGGYKNILVTCSFAYDTALLKDPIGSEEIIKEIAGAEAVLNSMKFKGEPKKKASVKE